LLNESKVDHALIEEDESKDTAYNGMNVCIGILVKLTSLAMHVKGLLKGRRQQTTN
jgi:hypothetical protein